jgi:hypothetical protein
VKPSLDAFDIMAARPGLRRFVFREDGKECEAMGTLGLARALTAMGHDAICPIKRERDRGRARHVRGATELFRDSALWPSYLIVKWAIDEAGAIRGGWPIKNWFNTRTIAWGQTAGIRWTLPAYVAERYRGKVLNLANPDAKFGAGQVAVVAQGPHRGQPIKILASRRNKDGSWTYQAEPPPYFKMMGKAPDYWIAEDLLLQSAVVSQFEKEGR